jgi:hypothetical protein
VHKAIQRRLLVEPSLTFEKAIETALAAEAAEQSISMPHTHVDKEGITEWYLCIVVGCVAF